MYNIMNVGPPLPRFFVCVFISFFIYLFIYLFNLFIYFTIYKDGYYIEQNIGTKTWGKLEFQFEPTLIICNVIQAIYIVAFSK